MKLNKNEAVVITDGDIIRYYTNFYAEDGYLIITDSELGLYVDGRYYFGAITNAKSKVYLISDNSLKNFVEKNDIKRLGVIYSLTSVKFLREVEKLNVEIFDSEGLVDSDRIIKSDLELSVIKKSCEVCEKAYLESLKSLKEGITELEFSAILEYNFKKFGGEDKSFSSIVAFGEGSAIPHYLTGDNKLKKDMPVLLDFGAKVNGYCSDMTRSFYFGTPTEKYRKCYDIVLNAHLTAFNEIYNGITCKDADNLARKVIKNGNYGDNFTHSLGHGVGVKIHESPRLSKISEGVLQNGNVFTIEPGIYINGEFGIRIEDTVALINNKVVSFMTTTKKLITL